MGVTSSALASDVAVDRGAQRQPTASASSSSREPASSSSSSRASFARVSCSHGGEYRIRRCSPDSPWWKTAWSNASGPTAGCVSSLRPSPLPGDLVALPQLPELGTGRAERRRSAPRTPGRRCSSRCRRGTWRRAGARSPPSRPSTASRRAGIHEPQPDVVARQRLGTRLPAEHGLERLVPGQVVPAAAEQVGGTRVRRSRPAAARFGETSSAGALHGLALLAAAEQDQVRALGAASGAARGTTASSTSSEARTSRPCSSHVYQVVPTPASSATSSRRRPGRAPAAAVRKPDVLGLEARALGAQEVGELLAPALAVARGLASHIGAGAVAVIRLLAWAGCQLYYQDKPLSCTWITH